MIDDIGESATAESVADNFATATKFWNDLASKMVAAGWTYTPGASPPEAARQVRSAIFKAMAEATDEFLRSPQFQEMMKQSLDVAIQFRKQLNDWLGRMHHELQGVSRQDVDHLMEAMNRLERRNSENYERLNSRLDELSARLHAVEISASKQPSSAAPRNRAKGARK